MNFATNVQPKVLGKRPVQKYFLKHICLFCVQTIILETALGYEKKIQLTTRNEPDSCCTHLIKFMVKPIKIWILKFFIHFAPKFKIILTWQMNRDRVIVTISPKYFEQGTYFHQSLKLIIISRSSSTGINSYVWNGLIFLRIFSTEAGHAVSRLSQ